MIVENKQATLDKASEISNLLLDVLKEEVKSFNDFDDPAEVIYLLSHSLGSLMGKLIKSLEGYAQVYGIERMDAESIHEWINMLSLEYLKITTGDNIKCQKN